LEKVNLHVVYKHALEALHAANAACMVALTTAERIEALEEDERSEITGLIRAHVATCERHMQRLESFIDHLAKELSKMK